MSLRSQFVSLVHCMKQQTHPYVIYAGLIVFGVSCSALSLFAYRAYKINKEEKAQEVFSVCMHEYDKAERDEKLWPNAELVFRLGFQENSSTSMAPYFLAFQAEALLHMHEVEKARTCMEKAVSLTSSKTPIYYLYATKYALMMMDDAATTIFQKGFELLDRLAKDENNSTRDMALYYLGLYHWENDAQAEAAQAWNMLAECTKKEPASPWQQLALEKSEHIVI